MRNMLTLLRYVLIKVASERLFIGRDKEIDSETFWGKRREKADGTRIITTEDRSWSDKVI